MESVMLTVFTVPIRLASAVMLFSETAQLRLHSLSLYSVKRGHSLFESILYHDVAAVGDVTLRGLRGTYQEAYNDPFE
jgi:hypothetical protein